MAWRNWVVAGAALAGTLGMGCSHEQPAVVEPTSTTAMLSQSEQHTAQLQQQVVAERNARCKAEQARAQAEQARLQAERRCQMPQQTTARVETIPSGLLFAFDEDTLLPTAGAQLDRVATALANDPQARLVIVGHTDDIGAPAYNQDLSMRRAQAVGQYLAQRGISPDRVQMEGRGDKDPAASNDTAEGRATNRRVDLFVQRPATRF